MSSPQYDYYNLSKTAFIFRKLSTSRGPCPTQTRHSPIRQYGIQRLTELEGNNPSSSSPSPTLSEGTLQQIQDIEETERLDFFRKLRKEGVPHVSELEGKDYTMPATDEITYICDLAKEDRVKHFAAMATASAAEAAIWATTLQENLKDANSWISRLEITGSSDSRVIRAENSRDAIQKELDDAKAEVERIAQHTRAANASLSAARRATTSALRSRYFQDAALDLEHALRGPARLNRAGTVPPPNQGDADFPSPIPAIETFIEPEQPWKFDGKITKYRQWRTEVRLFVETQKHRFRSPREALYVIGTWTKPGTSANSQVYSLVLAIDHATSIENQQFNACTTPIQILEWVLSRMDNHFNDPTELMGSGEQLRDWTHEKGASHEKTNTPSESSSPWSTCFARSARIVPIRSSRTAIATPLPLPCIRGWGESPAVPANLRGRLRDVAGLRERLVLQKCCLACRRPTSEHLPAEPSLSRKD